MHHWVHPQEPSFTLLALAALNCFSNPIDSLRHHLPQNIATAAAAGRTDLLRPALLRSFHRVASLIGVDHSHLVSPHDNLTAVALDVDRPLGSTAGSSPNTVPQKLGLNGMSYRFSGRG